MYSTEEKMDKKFLVKDLDDLRKSHIELILRCENALKLVYGKRCKDIVQKVNLVHRSMISNLEVLMRELDGKDCAKVGELSIIQKLHLKMADVFHDFGLLSHILEFEENLVSEYNHRLSLFANVGKLKATLHAHVNSIRTLIAVLKSEVSDPTSLHG